MNKAELIAQLAESLDVPKVRAASIIDTVTDLLIKGVASYGEVTIYGLGSFKVKTTKARTGTNPQTGKPMEIQAGKKISFKPHKAFKDAVS